MAEAASRTSLPQLAPGSLFAEHFRIAEALGVGATGVVYAAVDLRSDQPVALKLLHDHLRADPRLDRRFRREFRSGSSLSHPNIVRVFARDEATGGPLYLVMELLRGRNLAEVLREAGRFPTARIVRILGQVLDAVGYAHDQNIVHRDLKPGNVMVLDGGDDVIKVCDFGIAKLLRHHEGPLGEDTDLTSLSMLGDVLGTPAYMSPEQARGERLDGRSDLYSVAVMLYQMVTGELPFRAPTPLGMVSRHLSERPVPPSRRRPDLVIHPRLDELILRGLAKDQESRPATAVEFRRTLEQIAVEQPEAVRVRAAGEVAPDPHPTEPPATILLGEAGAAAPAPRPPLRRTSVAVAVAALAVLAPGVWWAIRERSPAASPPAVIAASAAPIAPAPPPPLVEPFGAPVAAPIPPPAPAAVPSAAPARNRRRVRTAPAVPSVGAQLAEADARLRAGDPEGACAIVARLRELPRPAAAVYRLSGKCLLRLGRADEAKRAYRRYLELAPDAEDAPFVRGILER